MNEQGYGIVALITLAITAIGAICFSLCMGDETYGILGMTHERSAFCSLSMGVLGFLSYCIAYKKLQYFAVLEEMRKKQHISGE